MDKEHGITGEAGLLSWMKQSYEFTNGWGDLLTARKIAVHYHQVTGKSVSVQKIGRLVPVIFTDVKPTSKNIEGSSIKVYKGLQKKKNDNNVTHSFYGSPMTVLLNTAPQQFRVVSSNSSQVTFVTFTGDLCNGHKVMKEVTVNFNGQLSVSVSGKEIDLQALGLSTYLDFNTVSVLTAFDLIGNLRVCKGFECNSSFQKVDLKKVRKESWGKFGGNETNERFRSLLCAGVVSYTSLTSICLKCQDNAQNLKRLAEVLDTEVDEENENAFIQLEEEDDQDLEMMWKTLETKLHKLGEKTDAKFKLLLQSQAEAMKAPNPRRRRWHHSIIKLCLSLWGRSPQAYHDLRESGFLLLPSGRLLSYYKNNVQQKPGFNEDVLHWMRKEAEKRGMSDDGWDGGIMFDEMSIQADLQISKQGGKTQLVGFVDMGQESECITKLLRGNDKKKLATHVLQLVYLADNGFRFPFCHFPTTEANSTEIFIIFWKAVSVLHQWGFRVGYTSMDGSSNNRAFLKMNFTDESGKVKCREERFTTTSLTNYNHKVSFIMDPSHLFKKIRNNILKSGTRQFDKRLLEYNGNHICWEYWISAYQWDRTANTCRIHYKLSDAHLFPDQQQKMRNKLAEEVLNEDMLTLFQAYQSYLTNGSHLDATIELLRHTSGLIKTFRDSRPIADMNDIRLMGNEAALKWFLKWEDTILSDDTKDTNTKKRALMSIETRDDTVSLLMGFRELCQNKFSKGGGYIVPSRLNTDIVENIFCQQRAKFNGPTTNPTYLQYCYTMNSIILGQSTTSKKSNTGKCATPPAISLCRPLRPVKKNDNLKYC